MVALGASNLTRGIWTVVSTARAAWGPGVQVLAAHGHGRSYGAHSRVLFRTLPGILESGIWQKLESMPEARTRALVTDVGNDILYGYSADRILAWIDEVVSRLQSLTQDIAITDLPVFNIRSRTKYLAFRSILFPSSRLSHGRVLEAAEQINEGLEELSRARGLRFFRMNPDWYGLDPIHIRPSQWRLAWQEILGVSSVSFRSFGGFIEALKLRMAPPERRWLFGVEQFNPQKGKSLPSGGHVWLY